MADKTTTVAAPTNDELSRLASDANAAAAMAKEAGDRLAEAMARVNYALALADHDREEARKRDEAVQVRPTGAEPSPLAGVADVPRMMITTIEQSAERTRDR